MMDLGLRFSLGLLIIGLFTGCNQATPTPEVVVEVGLSPSSAGTATPAMTPTPPSTSTPRLATPVVSSTPTATPTPTIYEVQAGDTLLSIAIEFETTTEALQEVNGIVDPRLLQIGQELIIPLPDEVEQDLPTPPPTPPPLQLEAINFQETEQGVLWGLGEVRNIESEPVSEVVIEAALLDEEGTVLAREAAFTQLDVIQPGETAPFAILFEDPPARFAQYQILAVRGVPISAQARYYFDLEPFDVRGMVTDVSTYRVSGQLRNFGAADAEAIRLVVIVYDAENRVLAQRQVELDVAVLKAEAITPFEVDLIITNGVVEHHKVVVQGLKVD